MSSDLLSGIKILDLTRLLPGPLCTLHLADMGADVLKVEDTGMGDYARYAPPVQKNNSSFFLAINRNKRSMALDLAKEEGKNIFLKLSEKADVIVESFRPGVVTKLGIDYETVKKIKPDIVYCSITGYGQTGPNKNKAGHDLNYLALSGILSNSLPFSPLRSALAEQSREGRGGVSIPNFQIADIVGGSLNAAMAVLAALFQKQRTGKGEYIDVSILDGVLAHRATALPELSGIDFTSSMLTGALPCYNIYRTADDRYMALAAFEFKFWETFCKAIGRDDLTAHHLVIGEEAEAIKAELAEIFSGKTMHEWSDFFKNIDCCVSPVLTLKEAAEDEHIKARNMVLSGEHPVEGNVYRFNLPVKFSGFEPDIPQPAPMHGEHTDEIMKVLGYSEVKIGRLKKMRIIL